MQAIGFDLHCRGHAECIAIAANSSRLNRFSLSTASSVVDDFWSATNRVIISPPPSTTPATPTSPSTRSWRRSALASKASWPTTRTIKRPRHPPRRLRLQALADRSLDDTDLASHRRKSRAPCRSFHQNSGGVLCIGLHYLGIGKVDPTLGHHGTGESPSDRNAPADLQTVGWERLQKTGFTAHAISVRPAMSC